MNKDIVIRKFEERDLDSVWSIISDVIAHGDTYVFAPNADRESMISYWCGKDKHTYVAVENEKVVGTFIIKDNYPGLGSHVANGSYMTKPGEFGKGIGSGMAQYSLEEAKRLGYKAMQFNLVVKTNERAVKLWKRFDFEIIGEIPDAFNHKELGLTNAYIMWRRL